MTTQISAVNTVVKVTSVGQIVITATTTDPDTNLPIRAIRIYADPVPSGDNAIAAFELRLSADLASKILIQAPNTTF